jgi:hypothetical protein
LVAGAGNVLHSAKRLQLNQQYFYLAPRYLNYFEFEFHLLCLLGPTFALWLAIGTVYYRSGHCQ